MWLVILFLNYYDLLSETLQLLKTEKKITNVWISFFQFKWFIVRIFINTNHLLFHSECGRTFQANSATFSSPSYSTNSPPEEGEKCEWRITATHGERIVLNITELDIAKTPECKHDYLEIRDGYWQKSTLLGKFCGSGKITDLIVSAGSRMLVTYVTANPKGHRGFTASYEGKWFFLVFKW